MTVSKRTRYEVLKRDNHTCRYCGASAPDAKLTVDHVTPTALGGSDDPSNLVAACRDCNYGKASTSPGDALVANVKATDIRWADAMKRTARLMAAERRKEQAYITAFEAEWTSMARLPYGSDPESIARLYRSGLPKVEMLAAVPVAVYQRGVNDRFAYFMGVSGRRSARCRTWPSRSLSPRSPPNGPTLPPTQNRVLG